MSPQDIVSILVQFGPGAVKLIEALIAVWNTPSLSVEQVKAICAVAQTSYDDYVHPKP